MRTPALALSAAVLAMSTSSTSAEPAVPLGDGQPAIVLDRWSFCNPPPYDCSPSGVSRDGAAIFYDCSCRIDGDSDEHPGYAHYHRTSQVYPWMVDLVISGDRPARAPHV
jgi:hypothetical protein